MSVLIGCDCTVASVTLLVFFSLVNLAVDAPCTPAAASAAWKAVPARPTGSVLRGLS